MNRTEQIREGFYRKLKPAARWLRRGVQPQDPIELRRWVEAVEWYHILDLPGGVETPGIVDHRSQVPLYGLPESLEGMRCLDIAAFDGFWSFEMERRGAAEVVAFDIERWGDADMPRILAENELSERCAERTGDGFRIAAEALGSQVKRVTGSVYELSPERHGLFDLVLISDLLLHLRDPAGALEAAFSVCKGQIVVADVYNPGLDDREGDCLTQFVARVPDIYQTWWLPSINTLRMMLTVAGFEPVDELGRFSLESRLDFEVRKVVLGGRVPGVQSWNGKRPERNFKLGDIELAVLAPQPVSAPHAEVAVGRPGSPETADVYQLPASLDGRRCLFISPPDGFRAAEMERRGASEVVSIDLSGDANADWSRVVRKQTAPSVYKLDPGSVGMFDLIVVRDLLVHLRDQQRALEALYSVCSGSLILADVYNPNLAEGEACLSQFFLRVPDRASTWWRPSVSTLRAMLAVAGFEPVEEVARFQTATEVDSPAEHVVLHAKVPVSPSWRTGEKIISGIRPAARS
jgi:tRNA (mo5U34)-methyltransferase